MLDTCLLSAICTRVPGPRTAWRLSPVSREAAPHLDRGPQPVIGVLIIADRSRGCTTATYTVGVIKIYALVFRELLSLGCINLENRDREDLLRIPKDPQLAKLA